MPPKKKASAKKGQEADDKELLARARAEIVALTRQLELKTHEAVESRTSEHRWRERAEAAEAALEQAVADMADIRADMARQQASLQDQSSQQLQGLEERMADAQAQMRAAQQLAEAADSRAKQLLQEKEHMAGSHEQEVQQLHRQYAAMMQGELGRMRERLQEQYNEVCGEAALS